MDLSVVALDDLGQDRRDEIVALCSASLETDCSTLFGYLAGSIHILARVEHRLVGHACWWQRWLQVRDSERLRTAWIDAVVVAPDLQRRGIGSAVMARMKDEIAGFDLGGLGTERIAFFEGLGWERWTGPTDQVLHDPVDALMILRTASTPPINTGATITAA